MAESSFQFIKLVSKLNVLHITIYFKEVNPEMLLSKTMHWIVSKDKSIFYTGC